MLRTNVLLMLLMGAVGLPPVAAQVIDDFSDGEFLSNPTWEGANNQGVTDPTLLWEVVSPDFQLQSKSQSGETGQRISYLSTPYASALDLTANDYTWTFTMKVDFTGVSSGVWDGNHARVYLFSDRNDLRGEVNGYFIRLREEKVELYRQTGTSTSKINLSGSEATLAPQAFVEVEVRRSSTGTWEVLAGSVSQGTAEDDTHTEAIQFGVQIRYTAASRADSFFFDDFQLASQPGTGPLLGLTALTQTSANTLTLNFNQEVTQASAEVASNYSLSGIGAPVSALINSADASSVTLNFANLANLNYTLTVNGVVNANETSTADGLTINVKVNQNIPPRAIIINEILADPETGLQESEYLELLSLSNQPIELEGFELEGYGNTLGAFVLNPGAYVVVTTSTQAFTVPTLGISSGALTNGGEQLTLRDANGNIIDQLAYDDDWYTDGFEGDGYALERINPSLECSGSSNWGSSTHPSGGTPGAQNSIFDTAADTTPPGLVSLRVAAPDSIVLTLSEEVDQDAIDGSGIELLPEVMVSSKRLDGALSAQVSLKLATELTSETEYTITIRELEDCAGNRLISSDTIFYYDITPPNIQQYYLKSEYQLDIIFSEALNSASVAEEDFLLDGQIIPKDEKVDSARVSLFFEQPFIPGQPYEVTVVGIKDLYDNEISEPQVLRFTYQDDVDTVRVVAPNALEVIFDSNVSSASAMEVANYLLEGQIVPVLAARVESMENAIRLFFKDNFRENRPLILGIENLFDPDQNPLFTPNATFTFDTRAPGVESLEVVDENSIRLHFGERLERIAAEIKNNYELNRSEYPASARLEANEQKVLLDFNADFPLEEEQEVAVIGLGDLYGNVMTRRQGIRFVFDTLGPRIDSIKALSAASLEIKYTEPVTSESSERLSNYLWEGMTLPASAERKAYDSSIVHLTFGQPLTKGASMLLQIDSVMDVRGNRMESAVINAVNTRHPYLSTFRLTNDTTLVLGFSTDIMMEAMEILWAGMPVTPFEIIGNEAYFDLDQPLTDKSKYELQINNVRSVDADSNLEPQIIEVEFDTRIAGYRLREAQVIDLQFDLDLGEVTMGQFDSDRALVKVIQDAGDPTILRFFLANPLQAGDTANISWTGLQDVFGRALPDHHIGIPFDIDPPTIVGFEVLLTNQLTIAFSEPVDQSTSQALNHYDLQDGAHPRQVVLTAEARVMLDFETSFIGDSTYQLAVKNIRDLSGNLIADTTLIFRYEAPYVPVPGDLLITEIMADPTPVVGLPESEYLEIQNTSGQTINLFQVLLVDNNSIQTLPNIEIPAGDYAILVDDSDADDFQDFGLVVPLVTFPSLGNSGDSLVLSVQGVVLDQVVYTSSWYRDSNKRDGGYSLERIGIENGCDASTDWAASLSELGGTPGQANSLKDVYVDSVAPELISSGLSTDLITLSFSEALDPSSVTLEDFIFPVALAEVTFGAASSEVVLRLAAPFPVGNEYTLTINEAQDCFGNIATQMSTTIGLGRAPGFNEIIITELMADPEPPRGLPVAEYLELYNPTEDLISMESVVLSDRTSSTVLPAFNMAPGAYIILTPTSSKPEFEQYGDVIGVSNWPSLNNTGDRMKLMYGAELVFSVTYQDSWYNSDEAKEGGVSLEMIDTTNPCGEAGNWTASEASLGGTPGQVNSVNQPNPDNMGPVLTQAVAANTDSAVLTFNEQLLGNMALWAFEINPGIGITGAQLSEDRKQIALTLSDNLQPNQPYTVEVAGVSDCLGNLISQNNQLTFVLPEAAATGDILINEVLFNPRSGGVDFVEVYNVSEKYINFKAWFTSNDPQNQDLVHLADDDHIIAPNDLAVFTSSPEILRGQYPQGNYDKVFATALPSMPNEEGRIAFISPDGQEIDAFDYTEDMHSDLLNDVDGVSLERVSLTAPTGMPSNWQSASSLAGFATPGRPNSQARLPGEAVSTINVEPKVFIPGTVNSFTTISYQDEQAGSFATVIIYDVEGRAVKRLAQNELLATNGIFTWDGTDENGAKARTGIYLIYFELYNAAGEVKIIKETVVLGASF